MNEWLWRICGLGRASTSHSSPLHECVDVAKDEDGEKEWLGFVSYHSSLCCKRVFGGPIKILCCWDLGSTCILSWVWGSPMLYMCGGGVTLSHELLQPSKCLLFLFIYIYIYVNREFKFLYRGCKVLITSSF